MSELTTNERAWIDRFAANTEGLDYAAGRGIVLGDPIGFSWRGCDTCGSSLGGDVYEAVSIVPGKGAEEHIALECCADCAMFIANGDVPDLPDED